MKALIVGGGIAGPVTAIALRKIGFEVALYEARARPVPSSSGSCLTIAVNGIGALRALDIHHIAVSLGFPSAMRSFVGNSGRRLGESPIGPVLGDGTATHVINRAELLCALHEKALGAGIRPEYGKRLVQAEMTEPSGVSLVFADGTRAHGDLLVGADGIHSRVRDIIDPAAPGPRYAGFGNVGGFSPQVITGDTPGTYRMFYAEACFFGYITSNTNEIWWFANPRRARELSRREIRAMNTEYWKERLTGFYSLSWSPAAEIISATSSALVASNQYDMPRVDKWHNDSMVIIGDAAHAPASASGQGASMAIEDGVVLAKCLRDTRTVADGFAVYERLRRKRTETVVRLGQAANRTKPGGGQLLSEHALAEAIERANRPDFWRSLAWLHEYQVDWHSPGG